jgi:hypothetical protein
MVVGLISRIVGRYMNDLFKRQVYASIMEILSDNKYFYKSIVGDSYSHLTEAGEQEVIKLVNFVGPRMLRVLEQELDDRAREMVAKALKE